MRQLLQGECKGRHSWHCTAVLIRCIKLWRRCVFQREDEKSNVGVELNKDLVKVSLQGSPNTQSLSLSSWL